MKLSLVALFIAFLSSTKAFAAAENPCRVAEREMLKIQAAEQNIAYADVTQIPEGGPYRPVEVVCEGEDCFLEPRAMVETLRYEPKHPHAREDGYVAYPSMNLVEETARIVVATKRYLVAREACR